MRTSKPDIVAIPVATELHHSLCLRVLEYPGVHLEVEKPICETLEEADEVLAKAVANRVRTAVHHQGRTGAAMRAVAGAVAAGKIGQLRHIIASDKGYYGGCASRAAPSCRQRVRSHTGILSVAGRCCRCSDFLWLQTA